MRRRPVVRKAVKSAIIVHTVRRLGRRAEQHLDKIIEVRLGKH